MNADAATTRVFERLDALLDRAPSLHDVEHHRLLLVAARRRRELGQDVPERMLAAERMAAAGTLAAPLLMERVRAAVDPPLLLVKGAEVARYYPDPALRSFGDLDLLVPHAQRTQRQLIAAGFEECGDPSEYEGLHHFRPLGVPELPLVVEVHREPKWVAGLEPPSVEELIALSEPAPHLCEGFRTLPPGPHALMLAAHTWAHYPLTPLRDLLDIALVACHADRAEIERLARAWRIERVWRSTWRAVDFLFGDGARPASTRIWARHLAGVRERTVLESHLQRWLAGVWGLPRRQGLHHFRAAVATDFRPDTDESWGARAGRTRIALRNAFVRKSHHDNELTAITKGEA